MKQSNYDNTYSIAWFKLADCVSRGEKERALAVYRLLSHNFDNRAFKNQLEGDIFLAFNDLETAAQKYEEAAYVYVQNKMYTQAVAIYDHLLTLFPDNQKYVVHAAVLYANVKNISKLKHVLHRIFSGRDKNKSVFELVNSVINHQWMSDEQARECMLHEATISLAKEGSCRDSLQSLIKKAVEQLAFSDNSMALQNYIDSLALVDQEWAACAQKCVCEL